MITPANTKTEPQFILIIILLYVVLKKVKTNTPSLETQFDIALWKSRIARASYLSLYILFRCLLAVTYKLICMLRWSPKLTESSDLWKDI